MVHHPLADLPLDLAHTRPHRCDDAAGLVSGDHGLAGTTEAERGCLVAGRPVELEIAAAHAGGLDGKHDLAGPRRRIGKLLDLELSLSEKDDSAHGAALLSQALPRREPERVSAAATLSGEDLRVPASISRTISTTADDTGVGTPFSRPFSTT